MLNSVFLTHRHLCHLFLLSGSFTFNASTYAVGTGYKIKVESVDLGNSVSAQTGAAGFEIGSTTVGTFLTHLRALDVHRFVADDAVVFKAPEDTSNPDLYPFTRNVYGYRSQSLYTAAVLKEVRVSFSVYRSHFASLFEMYLCTMRAGRSESG